MNRIIDSSIAGVFLDGKNLIAGLVRNSQLVRTINKRINNSGSEEEILTELISTINEVFDKDVAGIGVGVPSLVDTAKGIVYKVQNIQSWREVYLKDLYRHSSSCSIPAKDHIYLILFLFKTY
jgi:glucokinase